jgi:hypothetical protein
MILECTRQQQVNGLLSLYNTFISSSMIFFQESANSVVEAMVSLLQASWFFLPCPICNFGITRSLDRIASAYATALIYWLLWL